MKSLFPETERIKMSSSSNSSCAACKFLRRKCTQECVFAPYFPPDQPQRFSSVHKVFGASNVAKLLNELPTDQREDAVNSLAYEAEARQRDPVYGCVGMISILQQKLKQIQCDLYSAKKELSTYIGPSAHLPMIQAPFPNPVSLTPGAMMQQQQHYNLIPSGIAGGPPMVGPSLAAAAGGGGVGGPQLVIREPQQQQHQHQQQTQQYLEAQQLAALAVRDDQDMIRNWEQQQQQQFLRFHGSNLGGYEGTMVVGGGIGGSSSGGFNHQVGSTSAAALPSLALGATPFDQTGSYEQQIQPQQQHQQLQPQQQQPPQDGSLGELLLLQQPEAPPQQQQQLGHGDIGQGIPHHHHHEHNPQQQGSGSQSHHHHHHQNLLLQLHHQHEHIQQPQLQQQQQQQQRDDGIE